MSPTLAEQANVSSILLAILVNLKRECNKRQLFMAASSSDLQNILYKVLIGDWQYLSGGSHFEYGYLQDLIVFSDPDPIPFSPILNQAIEQLKLAGMICWPDILELYLMRLNPNAVNYYEERLLRNTPERLAYQDVIAAKEIAKTIAKHWKKLIVDRNYLMNLPN